MSCRLTGDSSNFIHLPEVILFKITHFVCWRDIFCIKYVCKLLNKLDMECYENIPIEFKLPDLLVPNNFHSLLIPKLRINKILQYFGGAKSIKFIIHNISKIESSHIKVLNVLKKCQYIQIQISHLISKKKYKYIL